MLSLLVIKKQAVGRICNLPTSALDQELKIPSLLLLAQP